MARGATLSSYFIKLGMLMLIGALFASFAALYTVTSTKYTSAKVFTNSSYYSIVVLNLFNNLSKKQRNSIANVDVAIYNRGSSPVTVFTAPYTNISISINPGENITLTDISPLDSLIIRAPSSSSVNVSLEAIAHLEYRPYLVLGLLGLVLFLAGSILLSAGIIIRFSGVEEAFT